MKKLAFCICLWLSSSASAQVLFETTCVFPVTPKNKPNYRIPALIEAMNGDLLVLCEKRQDGIGDIGNHDLVLKRSSDQGRTWGSEELVLDDGERVCCDVTVGIDKQTSTLWLFFLRNKKEFAYLTSADHGRAWQGPVVIHESVIQPGWEALNKKSTAQPSLQTSSRRKLSKTELWEEGWVQRYGCGPGKAMIQLKSGRLLVPARHREEIDGGRLRSHAHCFFSDDHGQSWQLGGTIGPDTSECQFIELNDGSVRVISRNESAEDAPDNLRHLTSISRDGGLTWGPVERLEELITPRCHGSFERHDQGCLLFCSPASPIRQDIHPYGRYNLTVRLSIDEGRTWSVGRTLWPHPSSYSDITILKDGTIGIIYERGEKGSTHYWDELHFARVNRAWIERQSR